jgi:hypothetical protein
MNVQDGLASFFHIRHPAKEGLHHFHAWTAQTANPSGSR